MSNQRRPALSRLATIAVAAMAMSGCMVVHTSSLSVTHGDSSRCPSRPQLTGWLCILDIPDAGYLGINGYGHGTDETYITVRMAPFNGVTAHWTRNELAIIDSQSQTVLQKVALDTRPLQGGSSLPGITDYLVVGYGPHVETNFRMVRRVRHVELRFPPIAVAGKEVAIPPIQLKDGMRLPLIVPIYSSH